MMQDWQPTSLKPLAGGQGTVVQVLNTVTGRFGGLKRLHEGREASTERRYRFLREVSALRALGGKGTPEVLEANETKWEDKSIDLFLVMEWIEGSNLQQIVGRKIPAVADAIQLTLRLCDIVQRCHDLDILHRDLKPDNVVLRGDLLQDPVLVDFGTSWSRNDDGNVGDFKTPAGLELGNRFLRLPDFAPGSDHYDKRSDITMIVGLLFFMLTNQAPRSLQNANGALPHELYSGLLPKEVQDPVTGRNIRRALSIGFQPLAIMRHQTIAQLKAIILEQHEGASDTPADEMLSNEALAWQEMQSSQQMRETLVYREHVRDAQRNVAQTVMLIAQQFGILVDNDIVNFENGFTTSIVSALCWVQDTSGNWVRYSHRITYVNGRITAQIGFDNVEEVPYFECSGSDSEGLKQAVAPIPKVIVARVLGQLRKKLVSPNA